MEIFALVSRILLLSKIIVLSVVANAVATPVIPKKGNSIGFFLKNGQSSFLINPSKKDSVFSPTKTLQVQNFSIADGLTISNGGIVSVVNQGLLTVKDMSITLGGKTVVKENGNLAIKHFVNNYGELDVIDGKLTFFDNYTGTLPANMLTGNLVKSITVKNNAQVALAGDIRLTGVLTAIDGAVLNSGGYLTLGASASKHAQLAALSANAKILGAVKTEYFVAGGPQTPFRTYRLFSAPVYDNVTSFINVNQQGNRSYQVNQLFDDMLITGEVANGLDVNVQNRPSAWTYGASGYAAVNRLNKEINIGKGLYVYYRGDRSNPIAKVTAPFTDVEDNIIDFVGILNQQNITVSVNHDMQNKFDLLGNPYASAIDFDQIERTAVENMFWTYNVLNRNYATYSNGIGTNGGTKIIGAGQGFFVKSTNQGALLTFKESSKVPNVDEPVVSYFGHASNLQLANKADQLLQTSSLGRDILRIVAKSNTLFWEDETAIVFEEGGDANFTSRDAAHWDGEQLNLSSLSADGSKLAINFTQKIKEDLVIKLALTAANSGMYSLKFNKAEFYDSYTIFLKDNFTNTSTEILANTSYNFNVDLANSNSFGSNRFAIVFAKPQVLSNSGVTFKVKTEGKFPKLEWSTINRKDIVSYILQKSKNGLDFEQLVVTENDGRDFYKYLDVTPHTGVTYYKLLGLDLKAVYNELGTVSYNSTIEKNISVFPNPFTTCITITNAAIDGSFCKIDVFDLLGKKLISQTAKAESLNSGFKIKLDGLASGTYIIKICDSVKGSIIASSVIIKQ